MDISSTARRPPISISQGAVTIAAAKERPGFAGYPFGLADDEVTAVRQDLDDLPATDAAGKASFPVSSTRCRRPRARSKRRSPCSMAESGGRAVERKLTLPIAPDAPMIGVKPVFSGRSLGDGANADFDVVMVAPDGKTLAQSGLRYELLQVETRYQWYRQNGSWEYEPIKRTERVADGTVDVAADKPARISLPVKWGRYRLEVSTADAEWRRSRRSPSMPASTRKRAPTRPTCSKSRSTRPITSRATP